MTPQAIATTQTPSNEQQVHLATTADSHFSFIDFATILIAILVALVRAGLRKKNNVAGNGKRQLFLVDLFTGALVVPFVVMAAAPFYQPALEEITRGSLKVFITLGALSVIWFVFQEIVRPLTE